MFPDFFKGNCIFGLNKYVTIIRKCLSLLNNKYTFVSQVNTKLLSKLWN
mgnify:CR=1 FL=1|jgi:hypothetical protein